MKDFGYDVTDYCDVDPMFGTLEDFEAMMQRSKELGLKVMIDQVYSHTSDQHPWFEESRSSRDNAKADWFVWADSKPDGSPPNNWLSIFGGSAWQWDSRRCHCLYMVLTRWGGDHPPGALEVLIGISCCHCAGASASTKATSWD